MLKKFVSNKTCDNKIIKKKTKQNKKQEAIIYRAFRPEFIFLLQRALGLGFEQDVIRYSKCLNETVGEIIEKREKVDIHLFITIRLQFDSFVFKD